MTDTTAPEMDWRNPDYATVFAERIGRLRRLRGKPELLPGVRRYYRDNPVQFITDWGTTYDPRNIERGLPAVVPFILFPRQIEFCEWVLDSWKNQRPGVSPKSRESGVSWLAVALSVTLCLFNEGMAVGFGSRKEEYVDKIGDPKSLFWKAREFAKLLPVEFRGNYNDKTDSPHMRLIFHDTNSIISGEAGDNIGRGNRSSIYFVDESAYLEHPEAVDASLSATTNCRIDISTAQGVGNPFHRKVTTWPAERVFRFHWKDDPRKGDEWYAKQKSELDPVTLAQEVDIDFGASIEGIVIPSAWALAAVDAHIKLGVAATGRRQASFDVADEGKDKNAAAIGHGILVEHVEEWSGKGDDIFGSVQRVFGLCDEHGLEAFKYDADGLGAGVRGDARVINEQRVNAFPQKMPVDAEPFRGSAEVFDPEGQMVKGRKNKDYFQNRKAQSWWALRLRFQETYRALNDPMYDYDPNEIISISGLIPADVRSKLLAELSQPTSSITTIGKRIVDKAPDGTRSPNLADAVMILFGQAKRPPMRINLAELELV